MRKKLLWQYFIVGETVAKSAKLTHINHITVQKYFDLFRKELAVRSDLEYQKNSHNITDYDEYMYLPKTLDPKTNIDKIKHFLTLAYDGKVYNLMMQSIGSLGLDPKSRDDQKILEKYLKYSMVSKISTQRSTIRSFWEYLEEFLCKYRGVSDEQFPYYLKEAEWRFNNGIS